MRSHTSHKIWFTALLVLVFAAGCGDPDKNAAGGPLNPPTVIFVTPPDGSSVVCPNTTIITATFSKDMNPATINSPATTFTLINTNTSANVPGTVNYIVATRIATFTPSSPLAVSTKFTATISTGVADTFGNHLAANFVWTFTTSALCPLPVAPVNLNTACGFAILAGSTVTNTGGTVITGGDVGLSPGSAVIGFPPGILTPPAAIHINDTAANQAKLDLTAAYLFAAGITSPPAQVLPGDLTGLTLAEGVWKNSSSVMLSASTLHLTGNANSIFVFQIGTTLTTGSGTQIILDGGVLAKNVFWQVGSSATLGTGSKFEGNILALDSITLTTGASLHGRALARNAAVTLDTNAVVVPLPCT